MPTALAVVGVGAALYGAYSGKKAADKAEGQNNRQIAAQAAADKEHAAAIKEQSVQEANKVRAESVVFRGKQVASQASSGVLVGNGSAQAMVDETIRLSERDAYTILYNGEQGYLFTMDQSRLNQMAGRAQSEAYQAQGQASLLSGISSAASTGYFLAK